MGTKTIQEIDDDVYSSNRYNNAARKEHDMMMEHKRDKLREVIVGDEHIWTK